MAGYGFFSATNRTGCKKGMTLAPNVGGADREPRHTWTREYTTERTLVIHVQLCGGDGLVSTQVSEDGPSSFFVIVIW